MNTISDEQRKAREFLLHTRVTGWEKYHVLGCMEQRVTLYSQQIRALNLIWALRTVGEIHATTKIAIIGGGVAGLTAAAAARHYGHDVSVLEQEEDFLWMQRGASHRWIHPRIYDWPQEDLVGGDDAGLPLMNWHAGTAADVVTQLEASWKHYERSEKDTKRAQRCRVNSNGEVQWNAGGTRRGHFDVVIIAVGFGVEDYEKFPALSYWEPDGLDRAGKPGTPKRHLISGCGDGGIIDLLRIRIRNFDLVRFIRNMQPSAGYAELCQEVAKIENNVPPQANEKGVAAYYYGSYHDLEVHSSIEALIELKDNTEVHLYYRDVGPYSPRVSTLNRFLLSRILRRDGQTFQEPLEIREEMIERLPAGGFRVKLDKDRIEKFDAITVRHGPRSALRNLNGDLFRACEVANKQMNRLDGTRIRHWPARYFGIEPAPIEGKSRADTSLREEQVDARILIHGWVKQQFDGTFEHEIDWTPLGFSRKEQRIPAPNVWENEMSKDLEVVCDSLQKQGKMALEIRGQLPLSASLLVGSHFRSVAHFRLHTVQMTDGIPHDWRSDVEASQECLDHKVDMIEQGDDVLVAFAIIKPIHGKVTEEEDRRKVMDLLDVDPKPGFRAVITAYPKQFGQDAIRTNEDCVALVKEARKILADAKKDLCAKRIHVVLYAPGVFALFLGQKLNALGDIVAYERTAAGGYQIAVTIATGG